MASESEVHAIRMRLFALVTVVTFAGLAALFYLGINSEGLSKFLEERGNLEVPVAVLSIAFLSVVLLPAGLLSTAAGFALGTEIGFPVTIVGLTVGAVCSALLARLVATENAGNVLGQRVARTVTWLGMRPFRSVAVARLIPGLPFNVTSYACGLTAIPYRTIALGTAIGFAPRGFAYTALGGSLSDLSSPEAKFALGASICLLAALTFIPRLFSEPGKQRQPR